MQKKSRASYAYDQIKENIVKRKFLPGEMLVESELCTQMQMSRTPVREALNRLRMECLVDYHPAKGHFVATFDSVKVRKIYEVLEALEGMLAYLLAKDYERVDFSETQLAVKEMNQALSKEDWDLWVQADRKFHDTMIINCDNEYLVRELEMLSNTSQHIRLFVTKTYIDKYHSTKDHTCLLEAVMNGKAEEAMACVHQHFSWMTNDVVEFIDQYHLT